MKLGLGIGPLGAPGGEKMVELAKEAELDLVQVAEGEIPVCRIMNYGKHIFQQSKQKQVILRNCLV